ncbi:MULTISPECIES: sulfurtransferase TusA family protein [Allobacillus]|uniref:Sulfurtransferase TusA family protein n=1 Tax=Allobacillus salarius TaxID=1955272 RepID=A0A556P8Q9_9BACI|nr:sulfurtransferase TusA family protein [Allobacillus salarius]TSJ60770.1 sulfurtransferase TusA family protein [Allobacillus salarius]
MNIEKTLDAKGLACPMPVVRTKKTIDEIESGQILEVVATDAGSKSDITAWTKSSGHELVDMKEEDGVFYFYIKKA